MISVIGLTGGIGCGKSTVARHFAQLGVAVLDADQLARDVVAPGTDGLAAVVAHFGGDFLDENSGLDRKKMGEYVFANPGKRRELEGIVIPLIAAESMRRFSALQEQGAQWAVYEASLLIEQNTYRMFPSLLVVTANSQVQLSRVMARDRLSEQSAEARVQAQLPLVQKVALAQLVIDNSSTPERLHARCLEVFHAIVRRYGAAWARSTHAGGHPLQTQRDLAVGLKLDSGLAQ